MSLMTLLQWVLLDLYRVNDHTIQSAQWEDTLCEKELTPA